MRIMKTENISIAFLIREMMFVNVLPKVQTQKQRHEELKNKMKLTYSNAEMSAENLAQRKLEEKHEAKRPHRRQTRLALTQHNGPTGKCEQHTEYKRRH